MLYKTLSAAVYGIDANIIEVEVDVPGSRPMKIISHRRSARRAGSGSRDRLCERFEKKNCGYGHPPDPHNHQFGSADIRKEGSGFDLPMALGILGAYGGLQ